MKAVGYIKSLPINDPESLTDIELPQPDCHRARLTREGQGDCG